MNPYRYVRAVIHQTSDLSPSARLVLYALAGYANRDGYAWPSTKTLAADTGLNRGWVRAMLGALVDHGIIAAEHRTGRSTRYRLPVVAPLAAAELSTTARVSRAVDIHNRAGEPRDRAGEPRTPRDSAAPELETELDKELADVPAVADGTTGGDTTPAWFNERLRWMIDNTGGRPIVDVPAGVLAEPPPERPAPRMLYGEP